MQNRSALSVTKRGAHNTQDDEDYDDRKDDEDGDDCGYSGVPLFQKAKRNIFFHVPVL